MGHHLVVIQWMMETHKCHQGGPAILRLSEMTSTSQTTDPSIFWWKPQKDRTVNCHCNSDDVLLVHFFLCFLGYMDTADIKPYMIVRLSPTIRSLWQIYRLVFVDVAYSPLAGKWSKSASWMWSFVLIFIPSSIPNLAWLWNFVIPQLPRTFVCLKTADNPQKSIDKHVQLNHFPTMSGYPR